MNSKSIHEIAADRMLAHNSGISDAEIAFIYDVAKDTIWSRRKLWKLPSGSKQKESEIIDSLKVLWRECYSVEEMAFFLQISEQTVYAKLKKHNIRDIPRLGIDAPTIPFDALRQGVPQEDDDTVVVITHKGKPKWALVPIEQYQDLINGTYHELREE